MSKIERTIGTVRAKLRWKIVEVRTGGTALEILSNPIEKTHTIHFPSNKIEPLDYLHELGHAWLGEHVHPLFSAGDFVEGTTDDRIKQVTAEYRLAGDWFVEGWMYQKCPKETAEDTVKCFTEMNEQG